MNDEKSAAKFHYIKTVAAPLQNVEFENTVKFGNILCSEIRYRPVY